MRQILPSCDHIKWKEIQIFAEAGELISLGLGIWRSSWEWISSLAGGIREGKMVDWSLNSWEGGLSRGQISVVGRQYDRLDEGSAGGLAIHSYCRHTWESGGLEALSRGVVQWDGSPCSNGAVRWYLLDSVSLTLACVAGKVYVKGKWDITKKNHQKRKNCVI